MPNDAKLGLVVGVGLVLTVAFVYFRKEPAGPALPTEPATAAVQPVLAPPVVEHKGRTAKGKTTLRQHTVIEGETLFTLAERYYGDKSRFGEIYQANRRHLRTPDELTPGTVLEIPEPISKLP